MADECITESVSRSWTRGDDRQRFRINAPDRRFKFSPNQLAIDGYPWLFRLPIRQTPQTTFELPRDGPSDPRDATARRPRSAYRSAPGLRFDDRVIVRRRAG